MIEGLQVDVKSEELIKILHTTSSDCHGALKRSFTNKHMKNLLEFYPWPVLDRW